MNIPQPPSFARFLASGMDLFVVADSIDAFRYWKDSRGFEPATGRVFYVWDAEKLWTINRKGAIIVLANGWRNSRVENLELRLQQAMVRGIVIVEDIG
jgi:hypothetical protein